MIFRSLNMTTCLTFILIRIWKELEEQVLNYDKGIVKLKSHSFFGNIYIPEGVKPDPSKVYTIKKMEPPPTKHELQSFLGLVNYLSSYLPHMSYLTSNLRNLLKNDSLFQWTESHETELQLLTKAITEDANLSALQP